MIIPHVQIVQVVKISGFRFNNLGTLTKQWALFVFGLFITSIVIYTIFQFFVTPFKIVKIASRREKCSNTEFFMVRIQENTDQKKLCTWTLFTQCFFLWNLRETVNLARLSSMKSLATLGRSGFLQRTSMMQWFNLCNALLRKILIFFNVPINPFKPNVPFLYSVKTSWNQRFSAIFRGYSNGTLG